MKLLILMASQARGGAEGYTLTIAKAAAKQGWEVHVAFEKTDKTTSLIQDFVANDISYHPLRIGESFDPRIEKTGNHLLRLARTLAILTRLRPDVVLLMLTWSNLGRGSIWACGLLKIPTAIVFQLVPPQPVKFSKRMLRIYQWARSQNQQLVTVSDNNRNLICETFQALPEEVTRIYNGAKFASNSSVSKQDIDALRTQVRQDLGLPNQTRLLLTVGRLSWQKGYQHLIHVIPHITKEFPDVKFVWVGNGELKDYITEKLREYEIEDQVYLLGYRSDVPDLLKAADLFVFPTLYEGQPFALLEAMAQGIPVISSNASGIPEMITDQIHGILFRREDSCDLLQALRWALKNAEKMQAMAENAKLRVKDFSEENMIEETLDLLKSLKLKATTNPLSKNQKWKT